jgi:hypothetical protein
MPLVAAGGSRPGGNEGRPIELNTSGATMRSRSIPCWIWTRKKDKNKCDTSAARKGLENEENLYCRYYVKLQKIIQSLTLFKLSSDKRIPQRH